jgi:hypothetical protein
VSTVPLPTTTGTQQGVSYTACPAGPKPGATPPQCIIEVDFGNASLVVSGGTPVMVTGTIPLRLADLPFTASGLGQNINGDATIDTNGVCPGGSQAFIALSVQATLTQTDTGVPTVGCSAFSVTSLTLDQTAVTSAVGICGNVPSIDVALAQTVVGQALTPILEAAIKQGIEGQACLH